VVRTARQELRCSESVFKDVLDFGNENTNTTESQSGDPMEIDIATPMPGKIILNQHIEATPLISQLQKNPKSFSIKKQLNAINNNIKKKNKKKEQKDTNI